MLLLRLGEDKLAADVWTEFVGDETKVADPYLPLAGDWTWYLFDRAVTAHMRGDDRLAHASAHPLQLIVPAIHAEAERRKQADVEAYLEFLAPLPELADDAARRAKMVPREPFDATALAALAPEDRVKLLIDHLDDVAA